MSRPHPLLRVAAVAGTRRRRATHTALALGVVLGVAVPAAGCQFHHGVRADRLPRRVQADGVRVDVRLAADTGEPSEELTGELLQVEGDGVLLLLTGRVAHVEYAAIRRLRPARDALAPAVPDAHDPEDAARALRVVARYPQGMPDAALARLLGSLEQTAPVRIARHPGPEGSR